MFQKSIYIFLGSRYLRHTEVTAFLILSDWNSLYKYKLIVMKTSE